jgi:hypothetical protein
MNEKRTARGLAQDGDIVPRVEGMEVLFDEKVTLFPVELEEIRDLVPQGTTRAPRRPGKALH